MREAKNMRVLKENKFMKILVDCSIYNTKDLLVITQNNSRNVKNFLSLKELDSNGCLQHLMRKIITDPIHNNKIFFPQF
jgi:hypothetical protein